MPLDWPGISSVGGDLDGEKKEWVKVTLNDCADQVAQLLQVMKLSKFASPIFKPWNLYVLVDSEKAVAIFTALSGGTASIRWIAATGNVNPENLGRQIQEELGQAPSVTLVFPLTAAPGEERLEIAKVAVAHAEGVQRANRLVRLGDISGLSYLEPALRTFLDDHPNPERNVFIMMRFKETEQLKTIYSTIKKTLAEKGFEGVRADERDYTGDLWSNIETYLVSCQLGVAVFEDIDDRDFNPNVSLELGYMMGRRRRCLLLKEQRLPEMPVDVVHKLYKSFDSYNIEETVRAQVLRWIEVDLGVK